MDQGSLSASLCVLVVCLLGTASCSATDESNCLCANIPPLPLTKPPPETCLNNTFRYTCADGYVRKAGTSNLIRCKKKENGPWEWTKPSLTCIPDPLRTTTTVTASVAEPQTTQSGNLSPEAHSTEPTSPGSLQATHTQENTELMVETEALNQTGATSLNTTDDSHMSTHITHKKTTTALITCALLVVVCALIGSSYAFYRRRSRHKKPEATEEEQMSMSGVHETPSA